MIKINENSPTARFRRGIILLIAVIVAFNAGLRWGNRVPGNTRQASENLSSPTLVNTAVPSNREVDFSLFWEVWQKLELRYIDKSKLDAQKMVDGAISGMVAAVGDPYTVFLPPKENSEFKEDLNGAFEGIGAQLGSKDDKIVIVAPLKDHPAQKVGLQPGDWIAKVNDEETIGWTVPQAVNKIRGPKGTVVKLTIMRSNQTQPLEFNVTRDKVTIKSVELEFRIASSSACRDGCGEIAWIKLSRFGDQTNEEWDEAVREIQSAANRRVRGVVLDMRNNPGGYFQSAIHIAAEFIKSGVVVIQENSDGSRENFPVDRTGRLLNTPLVVLINQGSASAAEIVAGAIRDHQRGKLIGEKTFGKGSVQTPEDLPGGAGLHITTARWIMPKGEWINGKGILPEIEVKTGEASGSADLQLERAISELIK